MEAKYEMSTKPIQWQMVNGQSVMAGDITVTPQAQALSVRLPFVGFVWNRPVAVVVEQNGRSERIPIIDITRLVIVALTLASAIVTLLTWRKSS